MSEQTAEQVPVPPPEPEVPDGPEIPLLIVGAGAVRDAVTLRVLPPHSAFTWAGVTVTNQPTEVPASAVPGLQEAAANAKPPVNLILEA